MQYQAEHYSDLCEALKPLHETHWRETENDKVPLKINHDYFHGLDASGQLMTMTARDEQGDLCGYAMWMAGENPKHQGVLMATNISFYVIPSARGHWIGIRLLAESEAWLKSKGVNMMGLCVKNKADYGVLAEREGYIPVETVWTKWLGE
jgi:GNAT superfamily N-acetyltransferase